ncbi:hypothetical protein BKA70DRAFT_1193148 [Coprinopsis sp. MPI-PUGE-AT-0042]|nr:hypothetical protein BKA70DRAFT_1193148 [Coprinopsis sp. MPI-PUGE-AT-0042]
MAYSQTLSPSATYRDVHLMQNQPLSTPPSIHASPILQGLQHPRSSTKQRFVAELSQCLFDFVIQLLPTQEEMAVKEDVRKLLERLIRTIEPDSRLLSFGSTANGFSLRNSDMDLCCLIDSDDKLSAADLVTMLGDLLERETKFHVKPLPHARIPIVKLTLDPSPGLPHGIACDIGFENRLALENTRLLMCYAMIDPTRVRTLVLFLKVWSKRRKINSPYKGTLSSYGYVLLVIYFLVHVKNPPVLPNLQQMPPLRPISQEETHLNGHNIWFFDDIELLRQRWRSENTESVAELLVDFFRYYARDFTYSTGVASIRAGLLKKEVKGWQPDPYTSRYDPGRERNRLCIEDPFEMDYNVARCVTKDGLYTIRGEFMRAARVLATRPERAVMALSELCEERKDEELVQAPPYHSSRPTPIPPQTPYTVGSNSLRPKVAQPERLSPPSQFLEPSARVDNQGARPQLAQQPPDLPEHMAPKRSKWTSPPPSTAPSRDHTLFQSQLDKSLELATAPTDAREQEYHGSETNSDIYTDEDRSDVAESDDVSSVRSFTEGTTFNNASLARRPSWHIPLAARVAQLQDPAAAVPFVPISRSPLSARGRIPRLERIEQIPSRNPPELVPTARSSEYSRRQSTGPIPIRAYRSVGPNWSSNTPTNSSNTPSPEVPQESRHNESSTVFYQTGSPRSPRPNIVYPNPGSQGSLLSQYQSQPHSPISPSLSHYHQHLLGHGARAQVPPDIFPVNLPPVLSNGNPRHRTGRSSAGPDTPTPGSFGSSHSSSNSTTTITAPTPPPHHPTTKVASIPQPQPQAAYYRSPLTLSQTPPMHHHSPVMTAAKSPDVLSVGGHSTGSASPGRSAGHSSGSSPTPSSTGYSTSISRSPSPPSPSSSEVLSPPPTAIPFDRQKKGLTDEAAVADGEHDHQGVVVDFTASFSTLTVRAEGDEPPIVAREDYLIDVKHRGEVART